MILPNFNIVATTTVSEAFKEIGVQTFYDAIQKVHNLPYGRTEELLQFEKILEEGHGTCSTKHATLKALADEHALHGLELKLVIFAMDESNTPGIGHILEKYDLSYMFEAHTYLLYGDEAYDYTFPKKKTMPWKNSVLLETTIATNQIGDFKKEYHKSVLKDWINSEDLTYTVDELWKIREECITALDQRKKV